MKYEDEYDFIVTEHGMKSDPMQLQMYAVFAEKERKLIGIRTKEGMAQLKKKYQKQYEEDCVKLGTENAVLKRLGNPNTKENLSQHAKDLKDASQKRREDYTKSIFIPVLKLFSSRPTLVEFVKKINDEGYMTTYKKLGTFTKITVSDTLKKGFGLTWTRFLDKNW